MMSPGMKRTERKTRMVNTKIVDMPDRRVALFVRLCMQNGGRLSATKRRLFAELNDVEVAVMQASVGEALADPVSGPSA